MSDTRTIQIEGWRFIPHSYAISNSFEILELIRRPGIRLTHSDIPYFNPNWRPQAGLFDPQSEMAIRSLPQPSPGERPDAIYRITYPYNCDKADRPTFVFGTSEFRCVPDEYIAGNKSLRRVMTESDCTLITCSEWSRDGFIVSGADPERVHNIGLGYDPNLFHPIPDDERNALREQLGWHGFVFLSLGSMTGNKGMPLLLKAVAQLAEKHPDVRLVLKGMQALYQSREMFTHHASSLTEAEKARVQERLTYLDHTLSFADMARLYRAADAYVSPYAGEGFNMPVLEAAASGCPVICTKGGSTDDFTRPEFTLHIDARTEHFNKQGEGGTILIPNYDTLLAHMTTITESPEIARRARTAGPVFTSQSFTWTHVVDRLLDIMFPAK